MRDLYDVCSVLSRGIEWLFPAANDHWSKTTSLKLWVCGASERSNNPTYRCLIVTVVGKCVFAGRKDGTWNIGTKALAPGDLWWRFELIPRKRCPSQPGVSLVTFLHTDS